VVNEVSGRILGMAAYKWAVDIRHAAARLTWVVNLLKQNCWGSCNGEKMIQKGRPPFSPHFSDAIQH